MTIYLLGAFVLSLICGFIFTPVILDYCKRKKLYDIPNDRKVHKNAIPRMGGISFFPSMIIAFIVILLLMPGTGSLGQLSAQVPVPVPVTLWSIIFMMGLLLTYITGIIDDLTGLNATTKFSVQIFTGCLLPFAGLYINNLYGLFGIYEIPSYIGIPLTVFMMVFIDNAINLIDGIDGLASGLSLLALAGFLTYFVEYGVFLHTYAVLIAGLIGALIAFSYFNLFGSAERNTKIFMGDSGSLSLGFILGFLTIKCAADNSNIWPARPEALLVPITLLFVPMADVVRVTLYRLTHHQPLFIADKNHIHHKLMRSGMSQQQALMTILGLAVAYAAINFGLYPLVNLTWIIIIDVLIYSLVNVCVNQIKIVVA